MLTRTLKSALVLSLLSTSAIAQDVAPVPSRKPLEARVEGNWRYGDERSILMSEFWVPIAQNTADGSVIYGDLRLMGDDQDNREFNIGAGYRKMVDAALLGHGIAGAHVWFDRRLTDRGSKFNQITAGAEWLEDDWDVRVNGYVPLNDSNTFTQANPNGTNGGFAGSRILVNTDQTVVEEALPGLDLELGYKVPFLDDVTDSTRVYAGAYHFEGDEAEDVTGWRARIASDITSDVQLGARFQDDDARGSQFFLEATIRFPFGKKQSFKSQGLYARLDESPERDIDIVSGEEITVGKDPVPLLNAATGNIQNVIHVNNTNNTGTEDGSAEHPYNTLAEAEAAASTNDLIYVHRGTGDTTGMNAGITINDTGQMLVGSGAALSYSNGKFTTANGNGLSSSTIIEADPSGAPTITNGAGDGITLTADNSLVSGLTIDGANGEGMDIDNANNILLTNLIISNVDTNAIDADYTDDRQHTVNWRNITAAGNGAGAQLLMEIRNNTVVNFNGDNITSNDSNNVGMYLRAYDDTNLTATVSNVTINNAGSSGFQTQAQNMSTAQVLLSNANIDTTVNSGAYFFSSDSGSMVGTLRNSTINGTSSSGASFNSSDTSTTTGNAFDNTITNSSSDNLRLQARDNATASGVFRGNTLDTTTNWYGILVRASGDGTITNAVVEDNVVRNSNSSGIRIDNSGGVTSAVTQAIIRNNLSENNGGRGLFVNATSGTGELSGILLDGNTIQNNADFGIGIRAANSSVEVSIQNNTVTENTNYNIDINDDLAGEQISVDMGGGALGSTGGNSLYGNPAVDLRIDLDGDELSAQNNWWGVSTGPEIGQIQLDTGSTIVTSPFLTEAP